TRNRVAWRGLSMGDPPRVRRDEKHGRRHNPPPHRDRPPRHGSGGPHRPHHVAPQYSPITAPPVHRSLPPPPPPPPSPPPPTPQRPIRPTPPNPPPPPQPSAPSGDRRGAPAHWRQPRTRHATATLSRIRRGHRHACATPSLLDARRPSASPSVS